MSRTFPPLPQPSTLDNFDFLIKDEIAKLSAWLNDAGFPGDHSPYVGGDVIIPGKLNEWLRKRVGQRVPNLVFPSEKWKGTARRVALELMALIESWEPQVRVDKGTGDRTVHSRTWVTNGKRFFEVIDEPNEVLEKKITDLENEIQRRREHEQLAYDSRNRSQAEANAMRSEKELLQDRFDANWNKLKECDHRLGVVQAENSNLKIRIQGAEAQRDQAMLERKIMEDKLAAILKACEQAVQGKDPT